MNTVIDGTEARKRANEVRERWLTSVAAGEVGLDELLVFARGGDRDAGYVSSIRLSTLLEQLPGWSNAAAINVLQQNGFKQNDTIKTLRSANLKADKFRYVFELPPPSFASTRPEMPQGWPWEGKLSQLVKVTGQNIPALEMEGYGERESVGTAERLRRAEPSVATETPLSGAVRVNGATGEVVDTPAASDTFWRSTGSQGFSEDASSAVNDDDLAAILGETDSDLSAKPAVTDDDIEGLLG